MNNETTLYNHVTLGTAQKPLIPNLIFKETLNELRSGDKEFYELILTEYTLEAAQKRIADYYYNKINKK